MLPNSSSQVSNLFNIIELIAESKLKLMNDNKSKIFGDPIFETEVVTESGLISKHYLQFTIIKDFFNDFFKFLPICKDSEPRYGSTRTKGFLSTV